MNSNDNLSQDSLEKRRKQIDRAKAAHLSRQLQTRLQYARLKVDHGWQKQTLNEVENLYFHHYRARLPLRRTQALEKAVPSVLPPISTEFSAVAKEASSSHRTKESTPASGTAPMTTTRETAVDELDEMDVDALGEPDDEAEIVEFSPTAVSSSHPLPTTAISPATSPKASVATAQGTNVSTSIDHGNTNTASTDANTQNVASTPPSLPPPAPSPSKIPRAVSPPANKLPIPRLPAIQYGTAALSRSRSRPQASRPTFSTTSTSSAGSPLTGSSNVALTYDSFWSTHSTSPSTYRSPLLTTTSYPSLTKSSSSVSTYSFPLGSPGASLPRKSSTVHAASSEVHSGPEPG